MRAKTLYVRYECFIKTVLRLNYAPIHWKWYSCSLCLLLRSYPMSIATGQIFATNTNATILYTPDLCHVWYEKKYCCVAVCHARDSHTYCDKLAHTHIHMYVVCCCYIVRIVSVENERFSERVVVFNRFISICNVRVNWYTWCQDTASNMLYSNSLPLFTFLFFFSQSLVGSSPVFCARAMVHIAYR